MEMKIGNRMICNIMLLALIVLFAIINQLEEELNVDYDNTNDDNGGGGGSSIPQPKQGIKYKGIREDFIVAKKNTNNNQLILSQGETNKASYLRNSKTSAIVTSETTSQSQLTFPNILMIGVQKGGTSATAHWMLNSGVCGGEIFPGEPDFYDKEVHFFNDRNRYSKGPEFYAKRFEHCRGKSQFIMDATPNYFNEAEKVHKLYSQPGLQDLRKKLKLILILREPISREISFYKHEVLEYNQNPDFHAWYGEVARRDGSVRPADEFLRVRVRPILENPAYPNYSLYANHLKEWIKYFSRDQLLILSNDELNEDPSTFKSRIEAFLGGKFDAPMEIVNTSDGSKAKTTISCDTERMMLEFFEPKNQELYELLKANPGPPMEQTPFPPFVRSGKCTNELL